MVEAALTALVIGLALPDGVVLLPYLVVPALLAGHLLGAFRVLVVMSVEVLRHRRRRPGLRAARRCRRGGRRSSARGC